MTDQERLAEYDRLLAVLNRWRPYSPWFRIEGWADGEQGEVTAQRNQYDTYSDRDILVVRPSLADALEIALDRWLRKEWGDDYNTGGYKPSSEKGEE